MTKVTIESPKKIKVKREYPYLARGKYGEWTGRVYVVTDKETGYRLSHRDGQLFADNKIGYLDESYLIPLENGEKVILTVE